MLPVGAFGYEAGEFFCCGYGDCVALPAADDWSGDRVEFRFAAAGYVLLHRAAHLARRGLLKGDQGGFVDRCAFGFGDCECFVAAVVEPAVGAGGAERRVERGGGEGDWREEGELVPEQGALVVAGVTVDSCVA